MLDFTRRRELAGLLKPVSKPVEIDKPFTEEQKRRMLDVVHAGEWKLIIGGREWPSGIASVSSRRRKLTLLQN